MSLAPEQIKEAEQLRSLNPPWGWDRIATHLCISRFVLRCEIDPRYRVKMALNVRVVRARRQGRICRRPPAADLPKITPRSAFGAEHAPSIPQHVLMDRDRRLSMAPRSLTAALCGDPAPGRSALDKMNGRL